MLTREQIVKGYRGKILRLSQLTGILESIPLQTPILIRSKAFRDSWDNSDVLCRVLHFNKETLAIALIAVEKDLYPFFGRNRLALDYRYILEWRPLDVKNLPVYLTWDRRTPEFESLLKGKARVPQGTHRKNVH